jgi:NAD(P)-dependent dehydrogenase (short-subunit alcohol dehydrogenase family)
MAPAQVVRVVRPDAREPRPHLGGVSPPQSCSADPVRPARLYPPPSRALRTTLPIKRVVGPADVAPLAIHVMANTALTGATYDVDGGQQIVSGFGG